MDVPFSEVEALRQRIAAAQEEIAERFRAAFQQQSDIPPNERWRVHLEITAAALLAKAKYVSLPPHARVQYDMVGHTVIPYVDRDRSLFASFRLERTAPGLLEYWMIISEILGSPGWRVTRLIAAHDEYDEALRRMQSVQIVRALIGSFLPQVEMRDDGSAMLSVVVYTRSDEERVERRLLRLDPENEFHFHSRELYAEGSGGVRL